MSGRLLGAADNVYSAVPKPRLSRHFSVDAARAPARRRASRTRWVSALKVGVRARAARSVCFAGAGVGSFASPCGRVRRRRAPTCRRSASSLVHGTARRLRRTARSSSAQHGRPDVRVPRVNVCAAAPRRCGRRRAPADGAARRLAETSRHFAALRQYRRAISHPSGASHELRLTAPHTVASPSRRRSWGSRRPSWGGAMAACVGALWEVPVAITAVSPVNAEPLIWTCCSADAAWDGSARVGAARRGRDGHAGGRGTIFSSRDFEHLVPPSTPCATAGVPRVMRRSAGDAAAQREACAHAVAKHAGGATPAGAGSTMACAASASTREAVDRAQLPGGRRLQPRAVCPCDACFVGESVERSRSACDDFLPSGILNAIFEVLAPHSQRRADEGAREAHARPSQPARAAPRRSVATPAARALKRGGRRRASA